MNKQELRGALEGLDIDVIKDGFCLLYEERTQGETTETNMPAASALEPEIPNFISLVLYLKGKYKFEELNDLYVEGGRVFFKRGGRRIELSKEEEQVTVNPIAPKKEPQDTPRFRQLEMN